jgi:hypothetical protein
MKLQVCSIAAYAAALALISTAAAQPSHVAITSDHVLSINGKPTFTIGFTHPPPPDARAPNGKLALEEFRAAGAVFIRTGPMATPAGQPKSCWDDAWIARQTAYLDAAARAGMYCLPSLKELSAIGENSFKREARLRYIVRRFKNHPGLGVWKGDDEPQWGNRPVGPLLRAYRIIHEEDSNHPVWIVQAPRGTIDDLRPYNAAYDIGGVDIYPISYPPGKHVVPEEANKQISLVGDYTQKMLRVVEGRKPIWLTLQIAWSGVARPGNTLRFPTFPEQRFMTYQAIINGARGLIYFGGGLPTTFSERDRALGWNWTYWNHVLRPVIEEIGDRSPLAAALCAPNSKLPIQAAPQGIEWCAREVGNDVFILACSREPQETAQVHFTGLPPHVRAGLVLYESPRTVAAQDGAFTDWFAPWDVHAYRFTRP